MDKTDSFSSGNQKRHRAPTQWCHIFKSMFDHGHVAKMGPYAFTVYSVIKSHANYNSGIANPSIEVIAQKSGISCSQVKRELDVLVAGGYLNRDKRGRSNRYTLIEKIEISNEGGRAVALASWTYVPSQTSKATSGLKHTIETGELTSSKIVSINRPDAQKPEPEAELELELEIDADKRMTALKNMPLQLQKRLRNPPNRVAGVIHSSE